MVRKIYIITLKQKKQKNIEKRNNMFAKNICEIQKNA